MRSNTRSLRSFGTLALRASLALGVSAWLAGCASTRPADLVLPGVQAEAERALQTRRFDDIGEVELLGAAIGVLQDWGFQIRASHKSIGLVVASKSRTLEAFLKETFSEVLREGLKAGLTLGLSAPPVHPFPDTVEVVLVLRPADGARATSMRVRFMRTSRSLTDGELIWIEDLESPRLYQQFFGLVGAAIARDAPGR